MSAFTPPDGGAGIWDGAADPLAATPDGALTTDVAGLAPPPVRLDGAAGAIASSADAGLAGLLGQVRLVPTLARAGELGDGALSRAALDAAARLLGVGVYSEAATDEEVRVLLYDAVAYHRLRGTPAGLAFAAERLAGQPAATETDPPAVEVVEQGSARAAEIGGRLPALSHPSEVWVVVHAELASEERWDASVGRALRHALPAGVIPTWVFPLPDDELAANGGEDPAYAAEALKYYAGLALGPGYHVYTTPIMNGSHVMDGTFTLSPDAVVARRDREFLPLTAGPAPTLITVSVAPRADGVFPTIELEGRDGGGFLVQRRTVTYRGVPYSRAVAEVTPYRLLRNALRGRSAPKLDSGGRPVRRATATLLVSDPPPAT